MRILGIDPGEVRVGVAVSDELGMLAMPVETLVVKQLDVVARISELAESYKAEAIVVGMPRNMDGSFGPAAQRAQELIGRLKARVNCPVIAWDERLTTMQAARALQESGRSSRKARPVIDQVAAQVLLQSYLDSRACG